MREAPQVPLVSSTCHHGSLPRTEWTACPRLVGASGDPEVDMGRRGRAGGEWAPRQSHRAQGARLSGSELGVDEHAGTVAQESCPGDRMLNPHQDDRSRR